MNNLWDNSIYTYCIANKNNYKFEALHSKVEIFDYIITYTKNTPVNYKTDENTAIIIIGFCIDAIGELDSNMIINSFLKTSNNLIEFSKRLAGKYVIIKLESEKYTILTDAIASIPVYYYNKENYLAASSHETLINNNYEVKNNPELTDIAKKREPSQAMPYDITENEYVKILLPNHYLTNLNKSVRFFPETTKYKSISLEAAINETEKLVKNIVKNYCDSFDVVCPLTGGWDSRLILAFLLNLEKNIECYTFIHGNDVEKTSDLYIPKKITSSLNIKYKQIDDIKPDKKLILDADKKFGENKYSKYTLQIVNTIKKNYNGKTVLMGDVAGQIGKTSLFGVITNFYATPSIFKCKLHNYSKFSNKYLKMWINSIAGGRKNEYIFDLFSWENRLGRWSSLEGNIFSSYGVNSLNIFNCHKLIELWINVDRKERVNKQIHLCTIRNLNEKLVEFAGNPNSGLSGKLRANSLMYHLMSHLKYLNDKLNFYKKSNKVGE